MDFCGVFPMASSLCCVLNVSLCGAGNKASATVQPFLLLHLDIHLEVVRTIEDALHLFSAPENLEGYRASAIGKVFPASLMNENNFNLHHGWVYYCTSMKIF